MTYLTYQGNRVRSEVARQTGAAAYCGGGVCLGRLSIPNIYCLEPTNTCTLSGLESLSGRYSTLTSNPSAFSCEPRADIAAPYCSNSFFDKESVIPLPMAVSTLEPLRILSVGLNFVSAESLYCQPASRRSPSMASRKSNASLPGSTPNSYGVPLNGSKICFIERNCSVLSVLGALNRSSAIFASAASFNASAKWDSASADCFFC
jgi:hypothetical protein